MLYGTSCYRYFGHETKKAFHYAQKLCWRHQSSLVSILTSEEETFVVQLAENNTSFWIGLDDLDGPELKHKEGIFKWSTGESIEDTESYVNWQWGEPNNRQHLDCVKADFSGWAMASGGCASTKLPFICKKRGTENAILISPIARSYRLCEHGSYVCLQCAWCPSVTMSGYVC